jgi:acetylornithine deacetylase/succinyl-diaminopimelate desuccinylase-like protein
MDDLNQALIYARNHADSFLGDLNAFLRIPSISTDAAYRDSVLRAATFLAKQMESAGLASVEVIDTPGHPVVYGECLDAGATAPTVLYYGHYDVQPVDPLHLWESNPFEPVVRGDRLYARGASDMKSLVMAHLKAIEAWLKTSQLPINIKFLVEGEEEIGSPNLDAFVREHVSQLGCTLLLNGDAGILGPDTPSLTYGLRGIAYFDLTVIGPPRDLHSGRYGGVLRNPALALCQLLSGMVDDQGRVTLQGFYDAVPSPTDDERQAMDALPTNEAWWQSQTGSPILFGEAGYSPTERASLRPSFDVNGLSSGFTGEGSKTVIPARAMAKFSMRLVPDQNPEAVHEAVKSYLEAQAPPDIQWEL